MSKNIDTIIIGSGISGLKCGIDLSNTLIIEKYGYIGGRIYTQNSKIKHKNKYIRYEAGAGRISHQHKKLLALIKKYDLEEYLVELHTNKQYFLRNKHDNFDSLYDINKKYFPLSFEKLMDIVLKDSKNRSEKYLRSRTMKKYITEKFGNEFCRYLMDTFGYKSEFDTMNAFDSVRTFNNDKFYNNKFYILSCGLSELINRMVKDYKSKGGKFQLKQTFTNYTYCSESKLFTVYLKNKEGNETIMKCKNLILTMGQRELLKIDSLKENFKLLKNCVKPRPLHRIYAIYPQNKDGSMWFNDISRVLTNNEMQYIIPINKKTGLIMITYTDGTIATRWNKYKTEDKLQERIQKNLNKIFPNKEIPEPIYIKSHYWSQGAHYWRPNYNSDKLYHKIMKLYDYPMYIGGETYSHRQAWMEGSLETVNEIIKKIQYKTT